jgi:hypothetical protein
MNLLTKNQPVETEVLRQFSDYTVEELSSVLMDLNVKSITYTAETICFGLRSSLPTVTLPRASIERSTIPEILEEIRDALKRLTKQAEPMNKWLDADTNMEVED